MGSWQSGSLIDLVLAIIRNHKRKDVYPSDLEAIQPGDPEWRILSTLLKNIKITTEDIRRVTVTTANSRRRSPRPIKGLGECARTFLFHRESHGNTTIEVCHTRHQQLSYADFLLELLYGGV